MVYPVEQVYPSGSVVGGQFLPNLSMNAVHIAELMNRRVCPPDNVNVKTKCSSVMLTFDVISAHLLFLLLFGSSVCPMSIVQLCGRTLDYNQGIVVGI